MSTSFTTRGRVMRVATAMMIHHEIDMGKGEGNKCGNSVPLRGRTGHFILVILLLLLSTRNFETFTI